MKPAIEVLFDTCANSLGRPVKQHTLEEFKNELTKDRIMREGVKAICDAMEKHLASGLQETNDAWKKDHEQLQVARLIEEKKVIDLQEYIKELEDKLAKYEFDDVIVE